MNLLLTGGTGSIGSHAAVALYGSLCNSGADVARRLAQIMGHPLPLVYHDNDVGGMLGLLQDMCASNWHWQQQSENRTT